MEKPFEFIKSSVVNFKLSSCCYLAPIKIGLIVIGYVSVVFALISLMDTANESFLSTIVSVQTILLDENATKTIPILVYCTDIGFSVLLLCAVYRNDLVLLRVYMYFCIAAIVLSLLAYSTVIAAIENVLVHIHIVFSVGVQFYVLLLTRSRIVEIKAEKKNGEIPTIVMSTLLSESKETPKIYVVEVEKHAESEVKNSAEPEVKNSAESEVKNSAESEVKIPAGVEVEKPTGVEIKKPADTEVEASASEPATQKVDNKTETKLETVDESPKE